MQPKWRKLANLGDVNPIDYGGFFVYRDTTGVYGFEAERLDVPDSDDNGEPYIVHRFGLDRLKVVEGYLVPERYAPEWPYPVHRYQEWFTDDLPKVADFADLQDIRDLLCSDNPIDRAHAYRAIGDYHGFDNLDSYPLSLTRSEAKKRYRRWL